MSTHTVAESDTTLSELIDRALKGEDVVVTRNGDVVARISGIVRPAPEPITKEAIDWLDAHRVDGIMPQEDAGAFVSRMRDEDWAR